jgi:hypothetical protein
MPNHCCDNLIVSGSKADLARFKKQAKSPVEKDAVISLNQFIPMPEVLRAVQSPVSIVSATKYKEALAKQKKEAKEGKESYGLPLTLALSKKYKKLYGADNWYDWSVKNWGTKWDLYDTSIESEGNNQINYMFSTAWSPPSDAVIENISAMYPKLTLKLTYEEPGMCFKGETIAKGGKITSSWDRPMTNDELGQDEDGNMVE